MSNESERTFGTELRRIRREAGKTLEDIANIMKVSIPHVSDIERGRRSPPPRLMIAKILAVWNRLDALDELADLAMKFRGEFQRAPKNQSEHNVLVALERTLDNELQDADYTEIMKLLEQIKDRRKRDE